MARVLLAWEFGAGLGHLNRLLPVAVRLVALGHEAVFAVPDPEAARPAVVRVLPDAAAALLAGPHWKPVPAPGLRDVPTDSFADVLRLFDAHRPEVLRAAVARWDGVLAQARPDLIVADFAPTLALAAPAGVPRVVLGNGYTVPPPGRPLPPMRPWVQALPEHSRAHEADLLDAAGRLHRERQGRPLRHLADLFSGDRTFVCTIAAFDPYGPHRRGPVCMPFNVPRVTPGPPVAERTGGAALYLPANHPQVRAAFTALEAAGIPCDAHIGGADPHAAARAAPPGVAVHGRPLPLETVLPAATALIHHGGLATAYAGLQAGVPQLVMPVNLEQSITARGLQRTGAAVLLPGRGAVEPATIRAALERLTGDPVITAAAQAAARAAAARPRQDTLELVVAACRDFLEEPRRRRA
ncbi:nucleotide disphospho-sugar-binding domain-containing protein [Azospirillum sp.]|uniref:nucleotide disphospho-sugar-binding domain-containing protein n=1 Tax=Azospirillum sp. TaxID=34012 RepID=UPI002D3F5DBA|nr:nucleotide disphospho-sugar-binding domain-containing protein [Azospirillum sp.]HYD69728.1 nucleotide disphospho-sugar-binding domain-containing protein [Azospirillum sp.]